MFDVKMEGGSLPGNGSIEWSKADLAELINKMEAQIPENDNLPFRSRTDKLDWNKIAFKDHTSEDCKKTWMLILSKMRRYRLLKEVLQDVKYTTIKPLLQSPPKSKLRPHLRMPRRPLSVFMLFFLEHKTQVLADNPGMPTTEVSKKIGEMYRNLSSEELQKYQRMAAEERRNYEVRLTQFYLTYYEEMQNSGGISEIAKQQLKPFELFYINELNKLPSNFMEDHTDFRMQCLKKWKVMSSNKKKLWIKKIQVRKPLSANMGPPVIPTKLITRKKGRLLKNKAGKPKRPPNSAYGLFSALMLQNVEIKKHLPKNRMKVVAKMWQNLSEEDKLPYKERVTVMNEKYKIDSETSVKAASKPQKEQEEQEEQVLNQQESKEDIKKISTGPPQIPPKTGFELFSTMCDGKVPATTLWKNLTDVEKREFEDKVTLLKKEYLKEFEQYLKSLPPENLFKFAQAQQKCEGVKVGKGCDAECCSDCDCSSASSAVSGTDDD